MEEMLGRARAGTRTGNGIKVAGARPEGGHRIASTFWQKTRTPKMLWPESVYSPSKTAFDGIPSTYGAASRVLPVPDGKSPVWVLWDPQLLV